MNKNDLVNGLSSQLDMSKSQVRRVVDMLVEEVVTSLKRGEKVQVSGLGTFEVKKVEAREGRNPKTNDKLTIPAHRAVKFKVAKPLKEAVR